MSENLQPVTREEKYMKAILEGGEVPEPITREEMLLNAIATGGEPPFKPKTRSEIFLTAIAQKGTGGGGAGQSGLPFFINKISYLQTNAGMSPDNRTISPQVEIPRDAVLLSAYLKTRFQGYTADRVGNGVYSDPIHFVGNPSNFAEVTNVVVLDGYKRMGMGSFVVPPLNAEYFYYDSSAESSIGFGIMPDVRIENNILYAGNTCEGIFFKTNVLSRLNPYYLEGADLRGSNIRVLTLGSFSAVSELKKVWLPEILNKLDGQVFYNCTGLEEVHFTSDVPPAINSSSCFKNVPTTCKIYVPTGTLNVYKSASNYPTNFTYIEE